MEEQKFTIAELEEQLKAKELDRQQRIEKFIELIKDAEIQTNCTLQVDLNSKLNNIQIIVISKT